VTLRRNPPWIDLTNLSKMSILLSAVHVLANKF